MPKISFCSPTAIENASNDFFAILIGTVNLKISLSDL